MSWFQLVPVFCAIINFFVQASAFRDYLASKQNVITEDDNYRLSGNELKALYPRLNGTVTTNAWVYHTQPLKTIEFKYNSAGLRVQKKVTANGKAEMTDYTLHGKLVTHMTVGNDKLHFFYDAQSRPAKVNFNGVTYIYLHNLQGDIVGILDNGGNLVVEYKYDAWGKPISIAGSLVATLGVRNPLRYRGYVYDTESGMYYLRSRYYDINTSRFINSDSFIGATAQMLGHNTYAYCFCSPILFVDQNGYRGIIADFIINFCQQFCQQLSAMKLREDKINITLAADAALALKDYPLADALFTNFLWGEGKTIGGDTSKKLSDALSTSKEFEEKIRRDYWLFGAPIKSSVTFTQGDLHYAIGSANYRAEVLSCGNMLHISL